ncbi:hypothetical protein BD309DRAFT_970418 [Dichomitus squalens]|nr:hypothetical protein BD309DRAFT_970418 [Dichomitus squalens]
MAPQRRFPAPIYVLTRWISEYTALSLSLPSSAANNIGPCQRGGSSVIAGLGESNAARRCGVRVPDLPLLPCASRRKVQYLRRSGRASTRMSGANELRLTGNFRQR